MINPYRRALDQLKYEVAGELGIANYDQVDKGALPSRVHGQVGGEMVRRLVAIATQQLNR